MVELYALELLPTARFSEVRERLLNMVPEGTRNRIQRFRHEDDAQRSLLAELLVRSKLSTKTGTAGTEISFSYNEHGKPFLADAPDTCFNAAHAGEWVVAAFSTAPVGVDVERNRNLNLKVAKRFFSPEEYDVIVQSPDQKRPAVFLRQWTLKESFLKATGSGISVPLRSFTITTDGEPRVKRGGDVLPYRFREYTLGVTYHVAVCALEAEFPGRLDRVSLDSLLNHVV